MELDDSGRPHISYGDAATYELRYAHRNGAAWDLEAADASGGVGGFTSIAIDGLGRPHIAYEFSWFGDLYHTVLRR